jgi:alpha-1,6-mannosyltransferase
VSQLITVGVLFRLSLLISSPELSDDFFRFIWDGRILIAGGNPYAHLPSVLNGAEEVIETGLTPELYQGLNSKQYYTVYPPVSQVVYGLGAFLGGDSIAGSIFWMRVILLLAEIGVMVILAKLLTHLNRPVHWLMWYAWNPLVIVETVGNLHFEGLMLFFILLAILLAIKDRLILSAMALGLAVSTKLIPLMLVPFFFYHWEWKKWLVWAPLVGITVLLTFSPFLSVELIQKFGSSVDLYFQSFEFNASIYYLVREIGFLVMDYNIIQAAGPILSLITGLGLLVLAFQSKWLQNDLFSKLVLGLMIYYAMATTVHPWYMITLVGLGVLSRWFFPITWSLLIILSYSHYWGGGFEENYWIIGIEYLLLILALFFENKLWHFMQIDQPKIENNEVHSEH